PLVEEVKTKKTPSRPAHNHPSFYDINNSRMLTPPPILSSTAVRYCASSYRWIQDRGKWSEQGYCTTEIDDFSKASIKNWEQRITVADSVGQIGGGNGSHQLLITTIGGKEVLWNWRADWYKENCCLDNPTREICKSIKNGGDYNKEFTMYYTLSTAVLPVMKSMPLSKIPPYSVENEECAPMDAAYFSSY
ncbi:hypothetical protein KAH37_03600, partial [bacterium]|nr:hypothetical protein [bacterium]